MLQHWLLIQEIHGCCCTISQDIWKQQLSERLQLNRPRWNVSFTAGDLRSEVFCLVTLFTCDSLLKKQIFLSILQEKQNISIKTMAEEVKCCFLKSQLVCRTVLTLSAAAKLTADSWK